LHPGIPNGDDNNINTGNANTATATVAVPSQIKILYLSDDGAGGDGTGNLDRVDPNLVSPQDTSTQTTAAIVPAVAGTGGGSGDYKDTFSSAAYNNSNGTESWSGKSWTETGDDGSASTGKIRIASNVLGFTANAGSPSIERALDLTGADTSQAVTLSFKYTAGSMSGGTEKVTLDVYNGTSWQTVNTFASDQASSTTYSVDIKSYVNASGDTKIRFNASSLARSASGDQFTADDLSVGFTKSGGAGTPATPATFTQAIPMASTLSIPAGGQIKVVTYISALTGTPTGANVKADLTYGSGNTTLVNLTSPTYDNVAGTLTWTGTLGSNVNIAAGDAVKLVVTNNATGVSFKVDYDSNTKPSRIELPTTTVIDIVDVDSATAGVQEIGFYDQSTANGGGSLISGGS
ncbi:MAG: hypothetical protein QX197_06295, partial [Methylococcaceae bacterium]